jgi:hypothetical protein
MYIVKKIAKAMEKPPTTETVNLLSKLILLSSD